MILIALGANLASFAGAPAHTLRAAIEALKNDGVVPLDTSPFYESVAWPDPRDPAFVNAVVKVDTGCSPADLMQLLHGIEARFGRKRGVRNAPRTLDLDLVDYNGQVEAGPPRLPHPRLAERNFVLVPLRDVAPGWCHPVSGRTVEAIIAALPEFERTLRACE